MNSYQQSLYRHFMDNVIFCSDNEGNEKLKEFDATLSLKKVDQNGNFDVVKGDKLVAKFRSTGLEF